MDNGYRDIIAIADKNHWSDERWAEKINVSLDNIQKIKDGTYAFNQLLYDRLMELTKKAEDEEREQKGRLKRKETAVIAISLHKGGSGKTSAAVNISYVLSKLGYRVLLIDSDSQMDATKCFFGSHVSKDKNLYRALAVEDDFTGYITPTSYENLDMIMSDTRVSAMESILMSQHSGVQESVFTFKKCLEKAKEKYDFVFIDMDKNINLFSRSILTAATHLLMVAECSAFHISGAIVENSQAMDIKTSTNPELEVLGIILNKVSEIKTIVGETRAALDRALPGLRFEHVIHQDAAFEKSQWNGVPIGVFDKNSRGYKDIEAATHEMLERLGEEGEDGQTACKQ